MGTVPAFLVLKGAKESTSDPAAQPGTPMVVRRVADLFPHPVIAKHAPGPSAHELSLLSERGEQAVADPITITHEDLIVDGYALWHLARLQDRAMLSCIVRAMDRESALLHLLRGSRGTRGISDFARVQMALELEPWFRERAKSNQRFGGREKGSAHLPEADRLDVRIEVARAAGVSAGNVSKVKRIVHSAIPAVQDAVLSGDIQIHRAASWARESPPIQARRLDDFRNEHGIRRTIAVLLKRHETRHPTLCCGLRDLQLGLRKLHAEPTLSSLVADLYGMIGRVDLLLDSSEVNRAA